MDCTQRQEHISAMLDGELEASRHRELFAHLSGCADCRLFMETTLHAREVLKEELADLPAGIDEEVLARLAGESAPATHRRPAGRVIHLRFAAAASIAALLLVAGILAGVFLRRETAPAQPAARNLTPTTVIMIYGMPPVDIVGTTPVKKTEQVY